MTTKFSWKSKTAAYFASVFVVASFASLSDSLRPPYVGWKFEVSFAIAFVTVLSFIIWLRGGL